MNFLFIMHSHFRWLVLLAAVVVILKYIIAILGNKSFTKSDGILGVLFTSFIDIQVLFGISVFIFRLGEDVAAARIAEHIATMLFALVLTHLPVKWKKSETSVRLRNTLLCYLGALALILIGVFRIRGSLI